VLFGRESAFLDWRLVVSMRRPLGEQRVMA
jgi:hypothetical protein